MDTNVFYSAANKKVSIEDLRKKFGTIFLSPISIFEVLASVNENNFTEMKAVAEELMRSDLILPDANEYLIAAWGLINQTLGTAEKSHEELEKFMKCNSFPEFENEAKKINEFRNLSEKSFLEITEAAKETIIPNYLSKRTKGKMAQLTKRQNSQYSQRMFHPSSVVRVLFETYKKALSQLGLLKIDFKNTNINREQIELAAERIEFYVLIAIGYMAYNLDHAPNHNDLADREMFVYLNNKRRFLTSDGKWIEIAKALGLELLIINPL